MSDTQNKAPRIVVEELSKGFSQNNLVLKNLNFSVEPGEIVAILGPSGCGKSTLLRLLAQLIPPTSGNTRFEANLHPEIAFIFQDPTLLPWKNVIENIALPLELRSINKEERRQSSLALAQSVGLDSVANYYPEALSGGMKMRVSLARGLALQPDLILFDEPFAALDAITRNRLNEELIDLHQRYRWSALFVTHSVTEAVFLANKVVLINSKGQLHSVTPIHLPEPREGTLRSTEDYQKAVAAINLKLHEITH